MGGTIKDVDQLMKDLTQWRDEFRALRAIILSTPLEEAFKWKQACYTHKGANVLVLFNLRDFFAVGFFKGTLLKDPAGVLVTPGENSQSSRYFAFKSMAELEANRETLVAYIHEAIANEEAGLKVDFLPGRYLVFPEELLAAFKADPAFQRAFEALTPGRQRGYNISFTGAKQSKTRASRVAKAKPRIMEGKGLNDRVV